MPQSTARWNTLALAAGIAVVATFAQWLLQPLVGSRVPFILVYPAVGIAAMWLGWRAGLLVLVAGALNALFWLQPVGAWRVESAADRFALGLYLCVGGLLVAIGSRFDALRRRASTAENALQGSSVAFCLLEPVRDAAGAVVDFRWEYLNAAARRTLLVGDGNLIGESARATFPSAWEEPGFIEQLVAVLDTRRPAEFELEARTQPGRPWFRVIVSPSERGLALWFSNITLRKQQEGELKEADRRKDEFLATLAHELRNPLAPIRSRPASGMFTQLKGPNTSTTVGLGIGLALARGLAHMHGATLTAASEGAERGSTFTLRIPQCDAAPPGPRASPARKGASTPRRVLVADDNRDAAESLATVLRMHGHDVALAFDGEMALESFRAVKPEVALLDIGMPGLSGNQVATAIRAQAEGRDAILVAITGWGQERDREAAREAGFDYHFTKPVNPEEVLELVGNGAGRAPAT